MKKVMILGAGVMQVPIIKKAKEMGLFTIVADYNDDAPGLPCADMPLAVSTRDRKLVLQAAIDYEIDGILTTSDLPVGVVAHVCAALELPGMSVEVARICTNKYLQREFLKEQRFKAPWYKKVSCMDDLAGISAFPVILKPLDSSGSRGVKMVNDQNEMEIQFPISREFSQSGELIVEEVVEGREFSVETITQNFETHVVALTEKHLCGEDSCCFVEDRHIIPALVSGEERRGIFALVVDVLRKLGVNNCAAHTEVKWGPEGATIIEIGCRLGGDFIASHLVPLATGVDLLANTIRIALGEPLALERTRSEAACVQFINHTNYNNYHDFLESESKSIVESRIEAIHDRNIENSFDRMGYLIMRAENSESLDGLLNHLA
jgi:biotin carboxylase